MAKDCSTTHNSVSNLFGWFVGHTKMNINDISEAMKDLDHQKHLSDRNIRSTWTPRWTNQITLGGTPGTMGSWKSKRNINTLNHRIQTGGQKRYMAGSKSKSCQKFDNPNPATKIPVLQWLVNSPKPNPQTWDQPKRFGPRPFFRKRTVFAPRSRSTRWGSITCRAPGESCSNWAEARAEPRSRGLGLGESIGGTGDE